MHFVDFFSQNSTKSDRVDVVLWELLTADVERIESVGTVGTMLKRHLLEVSWQSAVLAYSCDTNRHWGERIKEIKN